MKKNKSIVILGGAGFIGSHLTESFLNDECTVTVVDNFLTGNRKNIEKFEKNDRFKLVIHDVIDPVNIDSDVHYVLNFASPASPIDYAQYPIETLKVGAMGTHNALNLCRQKNARFLLASTSEVYGDPLIHPQPEDYWGNVNPIGVRSVYDEAKRYAEAITMAYQRSYGVDTRIVRIFNTYGPRMRQHDGRAIPEFIASALKNQDIPVFGDGKQTRSFCYIDDLVLGIKKILLSDFLTPVNCGNPKEMSIVDLAKKIVNMTDSSSKIVHKILPADDPKIRQPDITKISTLGWVPKIGLNEGLQKTIEYFKTL